MTNLLRTNDYNLSGEGDEGENKTSMTKARIPKNKMNKTRSMSSTNQYKQDEGVGIYIQEDQDK